MANESAEPGASRRASVGVVGYDIYFVRRDPGQSFEDALEDTEDSYAHGDPGPLTEVELEQWERILPRARSILGEVEEFADASTRELSHPATGVQLSIFRGEISITVPYDQSGVDEVEVMEKVYGLARAVEIETGLEGYDPQLGEPIRDALGASFRPTPRSGRAAADDERGVAGGASSPAEPPGSEATSKRRPRRRWWEFWKA